MSEIKAGIRLTADSSGFLAGASDAEAAWRRMEAAQQISAAGMRQGAISAGQYQQALRTLPAQLTDIVTGLQAGQSPLTVAIQQGGQIRDQFGGFGNALKGVGSLLSPTVVGVGALAAVATVAALAAQQAKEEQTAFSLAIASTNNAAGVARGALADMSRQVALQAGTAGAAAVAIAAMAQSGRVAASEMVQFASIAVRSQRLLGREVESTVAAFASLGRDPVAASLKLNEGTNYLTAAVLQQIMALRSQGRESEAAAAAQKAYAESQEKMLEAAKSNLSYFDKAMVATTDLAKGMWDAVVGAGRPETLAQQVDKAQASLERLRAGRSKPSSLYSGTTASEAEDRGIAKLGFQRDMLALQQENESVAALDAAARVRAEQARLDELSPSRQQARLALAKAAEAEVFAQKVAATEQLRAYAERMFQFNESTAKEHHDFLLGLDRDLAAAQIASVDRQIAAVQRLKSATADEEIAKATALAGLREKRIAAQQKAEALEASERSGARYLAPQQREDLSGEALRRGRAADFQSTDNFALEHLKAENEKKKELGRDLFQFRIDKERQFVEESEPIWQRMVTSWGSATQQMKDTFDNTVTAAIQAGESAWINFAQTGKLSVKSLVDAVIAESARGAFRQFMTAGLSLYSSYTGGGTGNSAIVDKFVNPTTSGAGLDGTARATALSGGSNSRPVTIINQSGTLLQGRASERSDGSLVVLLTQMKSEVKSEIASDVASGQGEITQAMQGRFGLKPTFSSY